MIRSFILMNLLFWSLVGQAQSLFQNTPEFQVSYFGELFYNSGAKVGIHFPFLEGTKTKAKTHKKRGEFVKTKFRQLKLGGNLAFYQQPKHLSGYLANIELTYQRTKNKSYKPNKFKHFEAAIGAGYYRYQLKGTSFTTNGDSFKETKGNGNAFMPSLSFGWGRTLRFIKQTDVRYFSKFALYFEIPHGIGVMPHAVFEMGIASSLTSKKSTNEK